MNSDGFQESGGAAALTGRSADSRVNLSTLGLRFNVDLKGSQQEQSWLSLRGGLGRRHASGDLNPATSVAWRGGDPRPVTYVPDRDHDAAIDAAYFKKYGKGAPSQHITSADAKTTTLRIEPS